MPETLLRVPFHQQPAPRAAAMRSRVAGKHAALALQHGDERAPEWDALHERARAVHRVQEPAAARLRPGLAELLAEDAVCGEARLDPRPRRTLRLAVGTRHRRAIGLELHVERG